MKQSKRLPTSEEEQNDQTFPRKVSLLQKNIMYNLGYSDLFFYDIMEKPDFVVNS